MIQSYEYPLSRTGSLLSDLARAHPKITVRDVPLSQLRGILSHRIRQKEDKQIVYILPKHKWHRILVLDPTSVKKH